MKVLVTGAAGFIGFHLSKRLLDEGHQVYGMDSINSYYDSNLKFDRLSHLGISRSEASREQHTCKSPGYPNFTFVRMDLEDRSALEVLFNEERFDIVAHMAAQAGVRYSLHHPSAYIQSNVNGFFNILENCRHHAVNHLVYASSSSVYGLNEEVPYSTEHKTDSPISLYAATKKSNELMAHTYSHLFGLPTTGLRFFTVYGPWGRPDMAIFLFTRAILDGKPLKIFNNGELSRDFTYIDDIVEGVTRIVEDTQIANRSDRYKLYNIGRGEPLPLMSFVDELERQLDIDAQKDFVSMQPGDVKQTWADTSGLKRDYGYQPGISIEEGIRMYLQWFRSYYKPINA